MARTRRVALSGLVAAGAVMAVLVGYLAILHLTGNFHEVVARELYRSALVSKDDIAA